MFCDLSIIIVSYNTKELTLACLKSVVDETHDLNYEIIVIDNASHDGSADAIALMFPDIRLIRSQENLGFARANNLVADSVRSNFLLLLNPDTVVLDGAIQKLYRFALDNPQAGIYGGKTLFPDGTINYRNCWGKVTPWSFFCYGTGLSALFKNSRLFNPEMCKITDVTVQTVDIVSGCFFLIERELWEKLSGFDPIFFMYGEEADLCLRASKLGYSPVIYTNAQIIHYSGASEKIRADKLVSLFKAKHRLSHKHWAAYWRPFASMMLTLGTLVRWWGFTVGNLLGYPRCEETAATWREVWKKRTEWMVLDR
ncbi:glycosyl transferase, group 2 family protein [Beggiatoa sp. PS]|nr:glycosyl transferase, group 2 family protein [Beggiatoa sp. PS]